MNKFIPILQSIVVVIIGLSIIGIHGVLKQEDSKPTRDNESIEIVEKQESKSDNNTKQEQKTLETNKQPSNNNQTVQQTEEEKRDQENLEKAVKYSPEIQVIAKATGKYTLRNVQDKQDKIVLDKTQQVKKGKTYVVTFKNDDVINVKEI